MSGAPTVLSTAKPLLTEGLFENPYPTYKRFLEKGPIHCLDFQGRVFWAVFSYADCSTGLRDPRFSARRADSTLLSLSAERRSQYAELARLLNLWMLFRDAPQHTRLRKLMNKGFSPAVVESLRRRVESMVDHMLDALPSGSEVDLLRVIAHPLPVRVIAEMLGIADTKQDWLVRSSDAIAAFFGNLARTEEQVRTAQDALFELTEFFAKTVGERRKVLTEEELHTQCIMLLFGGHETTRNLIGNGMYTLLRQPKEADELRQNPELIRSAIEELLRYESPVQYTARIALEDVDICGVRLPRGEPLMFLIAAANRDPQRFEDPDRLNLKRTNNPHLAFGAGAHSCIGNQLARLEGQVAIWKLLQKFPHMRLAHPKMEWIPSLGLRGLKELRVVL